ncbi:adenosine deaminase family protein [Candidatus Poribacteria bacterium]|nr:adenosine deaminase family protein [Candidatus Poribacteria bacterium]MBT5534651.1 adenosine deaminase family protein [Candidatus Poribacteria bacterium]MBT5710655.1 adenosine deaminase family protein [Candidatus Poribacteria bacterium]MBT7100085.1 adenosine deaminase family protein [Candidatus Poribacteria bacterium]MBT7808855.1 adenosine deaminase family protein [Candidatus Poribacteria bacterium]
MDITSLPKVELHCHYDGIVDPAMLRALCAAGEPFPVPADDLEAALPVRGLDDFMRWFAVADVGSMDLRPFVPVLQAHVDRLRAQNVQYAEIYTSIPRGSPDTAEGMRRFAESVREREAGETQIEFVIQIGRGGAPERLQAKVEEATALHAAGLVVGIAIAGPEQDHPIRPHTRAMRFAHDAGVPIEIHAGEWCGAESVWDALEYGYPSRVGHGVAIFEDEALVRRFRDEQIHIEMCPSSNVATGSVERLSDHPIRRAFDMGLNVGVNTDDPGAFMCSMDSEYRLLVDEFGFTAEELDVLRRNALGARFQPTLRVPIDGVD